MSDQKRFYLIDGSGYIYRAFYAIRTLTNSKGMPTQAIHGFARMIQKVLREKKPDYICVVFDAPGPTARHERYADYKATRQKAPEDMIVQIPHIKDLVRYSGLPRIELPGYEADDIIAALARLGAGAGVEVTVVSADKDLHSLIHSPDVLQWDPQKDKMFDEAAVEEKFGVPPSGMQDYLTLVGDTSDNVPGVKGVGDKTARQLLQTWGSLDAVYEHLDEVTPESLRKKLADGKESAALSRELIAFLDDVPLPSTDLDTYLPGPVMRQELLGLYREMELKGLAESLVAESPVKQAPMQRALAPAAASGPGKAARVIRTVDELRKFASELAGSPNLAVALETDAQDPMRAGLVGMALSARPEGAAFIPLAEPADANAPGIPAAEALDLLAPLLGDPAVRKLGEDLKFAWIVLKRRDIAFGGLGLDTTIASYLLAPDTANHGIDRLAAEHLGEPVETAPAPAGRKGQEDAEAHAAAVAKKACRTADTVFRAAPPLEKLLAENGLAELYETLEKPLIRVLARMEHRGILVEAEKLLSLSADFDELMKRKAAVIYDLGKEEFNILSPKQLATVLFDTLGLRVIKRTKTGPSTDSSVLEELALEHPIADEILQYRALAKLKGTYADALPKLIHPETGRIHTSYHQAVAATGRLSSSDPNLQNIPIRSEEGKRIRRAFIPAPGKTLLSADYSQIELRILAHYCRDEHLLEAFESGTDVHAHTAAEIFGIASHEVTPEMRRQAKTVNFGIIYGMGAFGLAQRLKIPQRMAKIMIDRYFERYSGVKRFIEEIIEKARKTGYTETLLGRKRAIPELQSRNRNVRQQGERLAVNTPLQGTAADLIKKAMISLDARLDAENPGTAMLLQVHDELVFEVPDGDLEPVKETVRQEMEGVFPLAVPLKVDMGWGKDWDAAHP